MTLTKNHSQQPDCHFTVKSARGTFRRQTYRLALEQFRTEQESGLAELWRDGKRIRWSN